MIVHDLKSPLSGIMGSLDFLGSGMLGEMSGEQLVIINTAKKSSENLLAMIQNLLDVAKMEEGKMDLHRETVDLCAMLAERRTQMDALAATERKTITVESELLTAPALADKNLIERVLNNLISNALHHTSGGGHIRLLLNALPGRYEVAVSDNGVGVPKEYLDKIFEKFVQVKRSEARLRTGAGLGLTFCRMAIEAHGGNIRVESELNKGSSFIFSLPK
jgi:signal transduction histidine kinase